MSSHVGSRRLSSATALAAVAVLAGSVSAEDLAAREDNPPDAPHVVRDQAPGTLHVAIDSSAIYGIGAQSFLGTILRGTLGVTAWHDARASGTADVGLAFAYHNEPTWLAPWFSNGQIDGAGHRVQLLLVVGHTFYLLESRALWIGLHGQGGWNRWISSYSLEYPNEGVQGEATIERDFFVLGGQLTAGYRFHDRVGVQIVAGGPIPMESSYVIGMFHVGAGLSFYVF